MIKLGVGPRTSTAALNLAIVDFDAISGRGDAKAKDEIRAYAAYQEYSADGAATKTGKQKVLLRDEAKLAREALYQLFYFVNVSGMSNGTLSKTKMNAIRLVSRDAERARKKYLAVDVSVGARDFLEVTDYMKDSLLDFARPLLVGTCPGLNAWINRLPLPFKGIAYYLMNDFFRSFGNLFWCCNPWSGLCFFLAIVCSESDGSHDAWYQASIASVAVIVSGLTGEAMGAGRGMMALGLLQFNSIIASQVITYQHIRSPPTADLSGNSAGVGASYALVVITSVLTTFFTLVLNSFVIKLTGVIPYAAPVGLALFLMQGVGFRSNPWLSMRQEGPDSLAIYVANASLAPMWTHDWSQALEASFRGIGSCVWADGWASALLCWLGIWVCSPILAMLGVLGSLVATCTMIAMDLPEAEVYGAWWQWEPICACLVIGGLIFHISLPSVIAGVFAAVLNIFVGSSARAFLQPIAVPVGPFGHGTTLLVVTLIRFHKTFMAPVPLAEMSVPEDHLRQRLTALAAMKCVIYTFPELIGEDGTASAAPKDGTSTLGGLVFGALREASARGRLLSRQASSTASQAAVIMREASGAVGGNTFADFEPMKLARKLDYTEKIHDVFLKAVSFGAFGVRTFQHATDPYKVPHADLVFLEKLYTHLDQELLGFAGGAEGADDATFEAGVFAIMLLTGLRTMDDAGIFKERWQMYVAEVDETCEKRDRQTRLVLFVYVLLRSMRERWLLNSWDAFFASTDKDHSGALSSAEMQVAAELAFPGETTLVRKLIQCIAEKVDTDGNSQLTPTEFAHMVQSKTDHWAVLLETLPRRMAHISQGSLEVQAVMKLQRWWRVNVKTPPRDPT